MVLYQAIGCELSRLKAKTISVSKDTRTLALAFLRLGISLLVQSGKSVVN